MKNILIIPSLIPSLIALLIQSTNLFASSPPSSSPHVRASLVSEQQTVVAGESFWVALRLEMEEHWHTYWINSGDSGTPTRIQWTIEPDSLLVKPSEIYWPPPERLSVPPLMNYGFSDEALLLVELKTDPKLSEHQTLKLKAKAQWLVCKDVCVPGRTELNLSLPIKSKTTWNSYWKRRFDEAKKYFPIQKSGWSSSLSLDKSNWILKVHTDLSNEVLQKTYAHAIYFPKSWYPNPESPTPIENAAPQTLTIKDSTLTFTLKQSSLYAGGLETLNGLIVDGTEKSFAAPVHLTSDVLSEPFTDKLLNWLKMFVFALVGGFILNLMPCVFPVLSIKILEIAKQSDKNTASVRRQSSLFSLGIILSFAGLGGLLVLLRAGGNQLGWGFQLQSPLFVLFLCGLFFLISLNLLGFYEVGTALVSNASRFFHNKKIPEKLEPLSSGVLATLIATPCTAPFMGSALGFAVTQEPLIALSIFSALGIGMSFPYLIVSIWPHTIRIFPKPGKWMIQLKRLLALPILATVLWLGWVLKMQLGSVAFWPLVFALGFLGFASYFYGKFQRSEISLKPFAIFISLSLIPLIYLGNAARGVSQNQSESGDLSNGKLRWKKFSPEQIQEYQKLGIPVFIDFTAAWCVTCQVNERLILMSSEVIQAFQDSKVILMKADWTSYDPIITQELNRYGRSGVPAYVLYSGETNSAPLVLPEILTKAIILNALKTLNTNKGE